MIKREIQKELLQSAKEYPVVTLIGPRQSGKTTLAKMTFPNYKYCTLEDPDIREFAESDPKAFLKDYSSNAIIDEIQRVPTLLSYIQGIVDSSKDKGQFILTGSHQLALRAEVTQSLAGRTAILTLLPLSINEVLQVDTIQDKESIIYKGFYPRVYDDNLNPTKAYSNYYKTYIEKDVRQLISLKNVNLFSKFLKLLAGRVGQVLNLQSLANDTGVSSTTLKEWLSVLDASFITFRLEPYFENFGKRVIKSPKIYFYDTGFLSYLLDIDSPKLVKRDPLVGGLFENLVIVDAIKSRTNKGLEPNMYFFRDSNGFEVDLVYKKGRTLIPIEIKSSSTFNKNFAKNVVSFKKKTESQGKGYIVYSGEPKFNTDDYEVINFIQTFKILE